MTEDTPPQNQPDAPGPDESGQPPPLFYSHPEPLVRGGHKDFKIRPERDFGFALESNTVPITAPEFSLAARHYPIIMLGTEFVPVVAVGLNPEKNLFIRKNGDWDQGCYIPAYVRRYPFILLGKQSDERLQLGVDAGGRSDKDGARALFENDEETETVKQAMSMCEQFHQAYLFTAEFSKALSDADLFEDRSIELQVTEGEKTNLGSFKAVSEEKFRALPDEKFLEFRKKGFLHCIYFHLQSLNNWDALMMRASQAGDGATEQPKA